MIRVAYVIITMIFSVLPATADEKLETLDLDAQRETAIRAFDAIKIPNPSQVEKLAASIFAKPIAQQTEKELKLLARQANKVANLVGAIEREYISYYRKNYRYDFVEKKSESRMTNILLLRTNIKAFETVHTST